MKKQMIILTAFLAAAVLVSACNTKVTIKEEEPQTGMANPWRDCTEEEAYQYGPNGFSAPEGATNVHWSLCEAPGQEIMVQLDFDYDGLSFTAREQAVMGEEITDISGMYYDWTVTDEGTLENWGGGHMPCRLYRYIGDGGYADLCLWFDIETGYAYSLSTVAEDLDGFDIQAVAEAIYDPAKQIGANAPDETDEGMGTKDAEEEAPSVDISGCDTFTQIVDQKLSGGMGYANEKIGDTDVLLVSSGTYDNLDGNMAAIDAAIFVYKDGVPAEAGKVCCGGTAYPLAVKDGMLYAAGNHWVSKYTIENDSLVTVESAHVDYDSEGNATYEGRLDELFEEQSEAEIINFSRVSSPPAYEYTGDDPLYHALYGYLVDEYAGYYPEADVSIPCPVIIDEDRSNSEDIKIWGNFWLFNYNLTGDTLECSSGGSYPGLIYMRETGDGYEVTKMDVVKDGSEYDKSAKEIFGKRYDDLIKSDADTTEREKIRGQIIADYVKANDLSVKAFKDYGWDPVPLP